MDSEERKRNTLCNILLASGILLCLKGLIFNYTFLLSFFFDSISPQQARLLSLFEKFIPMGGYPHVGEIGLGLFLILCHLFFKGSLDQSLKPGSRLWALRHGQSLQALHAIYKVIALALVANILFLSIGGERTYGMGLLKIQWQKYWPFFFWLGLLLLLKTATMREEARAVPLHQGAKGLPIVPGLVLGALVLALYGPMLRASFSFDDFRLITLAKDILTAENYQELAVRENLSGGGNSFLDEINRRLPFIKEAVFYNKHIVPVSFILWVLDYFLHGFRPWGYHLTNLLLHGLNCFLVFLLTHAIFSRKGLSWLVSLLFLFHPVHPGAVSWVSGRFFLLCTTFYLTCLFFFLLFWRSWKLRYRLLSLLFALLALFTLELAVTLPLALALLCLFVPSSSSEALFKRAVKALLPFFILLALFLALRYMAFGFLRSGPVDIYGHSLRGSFDSVDKALRHLFWPLETLVAPLNRPLFAHYHLMVRLTAVAAAFLLLIKIFDRSEDPKGPLLLGFLFFLIAGLPMAGLFPGISSGNSRYYYLPSVGFCLFASGLLIGGGTRRRKALPLLMGFLLIACYAYATMVNNSVYLEQANQWRSFLAQLKELTPEVPEDSKLYFFDMPRHTSLNSPSFAFLEWALPLYYNSPSLQVFQVDLLDYIPYKFIDADRAFLRLSRDYSFFFYQWEKEERLLRSISFAMKKDSACQREEPLIQWDLRDPEDCAKWQWRRMEEFAPGQEGKPPSFSPGPGSELLSPDLSDLSIFGLDYVELKMKIEKISPPGGFVELHWKTAGHDILDSRKSMAFRIKPDGLYHLYKVPVFRNPYSFLMGRLDQASLRFSIAKGTTFQIEDIRFFPLCYRGERDFSEVYSWEGKETTCPAMEAKEKKDPLRGIISAILPPL